MPSSLIYLVLFFAVLVLLGRSENRAVHYLTLATLIAIASLHIFSFNTDAEDTYIALRYVKNFVEGKGLVFNYFDRVEGYSDFLWLMIIAAIHSVTGSDIPQTARYLSFAASIGVILYAYHVSFKLTRHRTISYLTTFLIAASSSFACYGLSGLENPLFGFFILVIFKLAYDKKYILAGLCIGLATMTRPEGCLLAIPFVFYVFLAGESWKGKAKAVLYAALATASVGIPWTVWRVMFYGYLIPNTIAAKEGMDLNYKLGLGFDYSYGFLVASSSLLALVAIPVLVVLYLKQPLRSLWTDKLLIALSALAIMFILFYSYAGGDWMPAWRFYSSFIPVFAVMISLMWSGYVLLLDTQSTLRNFWIIVIFVFCGYQQIRSSFINSDMIPRVNSWMGQVEGLKLIGRWFHSTVPANTLIATFPNGAFSYYNELPTLDYGGLTDNSVGRLGTKVKVGGIPGHIASNVPYILNMRPFIIAHMEGAGFVLNIRTEREFPGYDAATFDFIDYSNPNGEFVNLSIRSDKREEILAYLLKKKNVKLVQITPP